MPSPDLLETLVKLASAGTSGICIFALFWSGYTLMRLPNDAPQNRHISLRYFMAMCLLVSLISAGTTFGAGYWDYKRVAALKDEVAEKEATVVALNATQQMLRQDVDAKSMRVATLTNDLMVRDSKIQTLETQFNAEKARFLKLQSEIKIKQPNFDFNRVIPN
jgi:hypothetical protein